MAAARRGARGHASASVISDETGERTARIPSTRAAGAPTFGPHAALFGAAAVGVACEALVVDTGHGYWLILAAAVATAALVFAWRRQDELRFAPILATAALYQVAVVAVHVGGGVLGDQDVASYGVYGSELVDGRFPQTEYPAGAVLLFGLEALLGNGSAVTPNRLLMLPFQLLCVGGIWGLHTRHSRWLAAVLAIWPMSVFYWQYRFDLAAAGLLIVGLLLAHRGRWGWSGAALGAGALVKWSPGVSFLFLVVWLVSGRRSTELRRVSAAFVAVLLVHIPLLLWNADNVLHPYTAQGGRAITNESVWYFPLRIVGLARGGAEWAPAGAPKAADVVVVAIQAALMISLALAVVSVRGSPRCAIAVAALAPAVFLMTNRVFSPQFMLVVAAAVLVACALTARSRNEQLVVGLLVMGAILANAFVYPYSGALFDLSWTPASATVYLLTLPALLIVLRSALAQRAAASIAWRTDSLPDFGFRDAATVVSARDEPLDSPPPFVPTWSRRVLASATGLVTALFLVAAVFVGVVLPFRYWDSLALGSWPRSIAEGNGLWDNASTFALSRPVVYVPEGLAWRYLDDGDWIGRVYSLLFAVALVTAVWLLAGRLPRRADAIPVTRTLSLGLLLGSAVFAGLVAAGMTDIPVAAGSAATAVVLWQAPSRWWLLLLVGAFAAATVLSKSSGLLALAGLAVALVVLNGRRATPGLVAMAVGVGLALTYDAWQASRLGQSLFDFLRAGNERYWLDRGAAARWDALAQAEWLGVSIRLLILYGVLHGIARAAGTRPRIALAVAAVGAITWSVVGPLVADGGAPYPFDGSVLGLLAWLVAAAAMCAAPFLAQGDPIERRVHIALIVWLAPTAVVWWWTRADEVRHLAPVWPAFVLVTAAALVSVSFALARLRPAAFVVPALAVLLLAVVNLPSVDGLGRSGWRGLLDLGWSDWSDRAAVENYAWGPFSYVVNLARANVTDSQRVVTSDGRLAYFFPGRIDVEYARTCGALEGARFFSYLTSGESLAFAQSEEQPTDPLGWIQCAKPAVRLVGEQAGIYAAFVVGGPPARPSTLDDCHIAPTSGQLNDAVFGSDLGYAEASDLAQRALDSGFQGARVERTGCDAFRVVVTGIPDDPAVQKEFRKETAGVGFDVSFVPATRYPEVERGIAPVPP
jgi:hypothetical protein